MTDSGIYDLLVILTAGLAAGLASKRLKAPLPIGYMLVGALLAATGVIQESNATIVELAEAGVFFLLFAVGLEFSLDELLRLRRAIFVGGITQMLLVAAPVTALLLVMQFDFRTSLLLGTAVSFSSTVLVFKTLAEWGRTSTKEGHHAIGILLFQDIALIPLLLVIPLFAVGDAPGLYDYSVLFLVSVSFVASVVGVRAILSKWLIPHLISYRSPELVALAAIVVLGLVTFTAYRLGLPPAVGAFAAGLMLSGNRWTAQFDALVMPFREIFAVVFFVSLGLLLDIEVVLAQPLQLLALFAALLFIKGLAAIVALRFTRLSWNSAFSTGIGLAHVGEFAFVLIGLMLQVELIDEVITKQFVAIALASLMLSPLFLRHGLHRISQVVLEGKSTEPLPHLLDSISHYSVVIGIGPIGSQIGSQLETMGHEVCMIDRSALNLQPFEQQGIRVISGDAVEEETLLRAQIPQATLVVICLPDDTASIAVLKQLQRLNPQCKIVIRCRYQANISRLMNGGADHVISEESQSVKALLELLAEAKE